MDDDQARDAGVRPPVALVIGAGPGLGLAVARRFAREGFAVGLVARDAARLSRLAAEVVAAVPSDAGGGSGGPGGPARASAGAAGFPADVADPESLRAAIAAARDRYGDPSVLVFNPSLHVEGPLASVPVDAFTRAMAIGVTGFVLALQAVAPAMVARGAGTVLATGSGGGLHPRGGWATLAAQKAALRALVLAAAQELAPQGVHVATVTVLGLLGTPGFAPDDVAERFWSLHAEPRADWQAEVVHRG